MPITALNRILAKTQFGKYLHYLLENGIAGDEKLFIGHDREHYTIIMPQDAELKTDGWNE